MKINFHIKRAYTINGRKYGSLDEMPPDVRAFFLKGTVPLLKKIRR